MVRSLTSTPLPRPKHSVGDDFVTALPLLISVVVPVTVPWVWLWQQEFVQLLRPRKWLLPGEFNPESDWQLIDPLGFRRAGINYPAGSIRFDRPPIATLHDDAIFDTRYRLHATSLFWEPPKSVLHHNLTAQIVNIGA
ncbi:MAG: hypothetical protein HYT48_01955 [Candidatus Vogelbacteria bacterium]|nr:hypothetical protein [Candidatus Vogelbacteria bacterium]